MCAITFTHANNERNVEKCSLWKDTKSEGDGEERVGKGTGPSKETNRRNTLQERERLTVRDCCHNEREGVRYTVATGIELQGFVLTPTRWDSSKHQCVSGNSKVGAVCVCSPFVHIVYVWMQYIVQYACAISAWTEIFHGNIKK